MSCRGRIAALGIVMGVVLIPCIADLAHAQGKITFLASAGRPDRLTFKARGVPVSPLVPDVEGLEVSLSNDAGLVYSETLLARTIVPNSAGTRWKYSADRDGDGVYDLVVTKKPRSDGAFVYSVKLRLDADLAAVDPIRSGMSEDLLSSMGVAVDAGEDVLVASAAWERTSSGWRTRSNTFAARYFGPAKRTFVSSDCYLGSLGGLGGADAKCQDLADVAGLMGTFTAWLADAFDGPSVRLSHASEPYVLVDGTVIARDWNDLVDGEIAAPIHLDESGSSVTDDPECGTAVWTNTTTLGTVAVSDALEFACYEWSLSLFSRWGLAGDATATNSAWTDGGPLGLLRCSSLARLYCFER